ncbi:MAG: hypothetical protein P0Y55_08435 [Candidatus Cohnella colombiensis]|uniref:Uncharacterized protein n=1 Tax=Candidatus Cohnella colombiensis TaxID=3121368 RepID=A0AA95F6T2_9BACL|nr:MAG: hypothetical protein P0Y55_08435 [Cohnella sp.]
MNPFPKEHELIDVFESEPKIKDNETPFYYNHLEYLLTRDNGSLQCELEPGIHWARVIWKQKDETLVDLELESIKGIEIEKRNGKEFIHFIFYEGNGIKNLIVRTKPNFSISWGTLRE